MPVILVLLLMRGKIEPSPTDLLDIETNGHLTGHDWSVLEVVEELIAWKRQDARSDVSLSSKLAAGALPPGQRLGSQVSVASVISWSSTAPSDCSGQPAR